MCTTLLVKHRRPRSDGVQRTWTGLASAWKWTNTGIISVTIIIIITSAWLLPPPFVSQIRAEWLHIMERKRINLRYHHPRFHKKPQTCVPLGCWFIPLIITGTPSWMCFSHAVIPQLDDRNIKDLSWIIFVPRISGFISSFSVIFLIFSKYLAGQSWQMKAADEFNRHYCFCSL